MKLDTFYEIIKKTNKCEVVQLTKIISDIFSEIDEYEETRDLDVQKLMDCVVSLPVWVGIADEFHNLSVNFANKDKFLHAADVVRQGLRQYPKSTDLIADILKYASRGDAKAMVECQQQFEVLETIPKKQWTWRAYDFAIDFLKESIIKGLGDADVLQAQAHEISDAFIKAYPNDERAYYSKSVLFEEERLEKDQLDMLNKGMEKGSSAPRCMLKLADISFKKKEYKLALEYLNRCKKEGVTLESGISNGYVYILSALSKISIIYSHWNPTVPLTDDLVVEIHDIFRDYQIAVIYEGWQSERVQTLKKHLDSIEVVTGIHGNY